MVFLRPILPEDRERMLDILTSPEVAKTYMLPDYKNREDALHIYFHLMEMSEESDVEYVRAIATEEGLVGFLNHQEIEKLSIELGYVIHPAFHGKGYMTEALHLAIGELFDMGYHQVTAGAFATNTASIRCMEKCGMTKIDKTETFEYRGATHTCVYYAATNPSPMTFSCCFCGKAVAPYNSFILTIRRVNDANDTRQVLYCHRKCMERKLKDPKSLYLLYT